jgi:hypothetical protein
MTPTGSSPGGRFGFRGIKTISLPVCKDCQRFHQAAGAPGSGHLGSRELFAGTKLSKGEFVADLILRAAKSAAMPGRRRFEQPTQRPCPQKNHSAYSLTTKTAKSRFFS